MSGALGIKAQELDPAEKPKGVKIIQAMPVAAMSAMGEGSNLMVLGLGDDSEIYVWHAKKRTWMEK